MRGPLFGVYMSAPDFGKLPNIFVTWLHGLVHGTALDSTWAWTTDRGLHARPCDPAFRSWKSHLGANSGVLSYKKLSEGGKPSQGKEYVLQRFSSRGDAETLGPPCQEVPTIFRRLHTGVVASQNRPEADGLRDTGSAVGASTITNASALYSQNSYSIRYLKYAS